LILFTALFLASGFIRAFEAMLQVDRWFKLTGGVSHARSTVPSSWF
jgi:hypothetical protein